MSGRAHRTTASGVGGGGAVGRAGDRASPVVGALGALPVVDGLPPSAPAADPSALCVETAPAEACGVPVTDVSAALLRASTVEEVHQVVRSAARRVTHADGATVVLLDGDRCYYADEDSMSPLWKGQRFPAATCISGWAMRHRRTAVVPDIRVDPRIPQAAYRPTFVQSLLMTPILRPDPIGALGAYWATGHHATGAEVAALEALAVEAGEAFERFPEGVPARWAAGPAEG